MTSKIEVGDKIHIEFTVYEICDGGPQDGLMVLNRRGDAGLIRCHSIFKNDPVIVKHIPKPYEPEAGDIVSYMGGCSHWKVLAVDSGRAWCRCVHTKNERLYESNVLTFISKG